MVSYSSAKIVWWKGPCGHEWRSSIDNRSRGNGCPICAGSQILIGFNDLLTTHPQLSAEWCYEKNGRLTPTQVTKGSHKKVWWHCPKGHNDYESTICNRVQGKGCPICSIEKRSLSRNQNRIRKNGSLSQTHPLIAAEWNFHAKIKPKSDYPLKTLYPRAFQTGQNHLIYYDFTTVE